MTTFQRIPWLRIGAESIAIVASILLAFWIDAWWAGRTETIRTNDLLHSLEDEWNRELDRMDSTLDQITRYRNGMTEVFRIRQRGPELLSEEEALQLFRDSGWSTYKPSTAALDIVLENGLTVIDDSTLALAISSWHSVLQETAPEQNALFDVSLGRLTEVRQNVAHQLELSIVNSSEPSPLTLYGSEAGRLAIAILFDDEFVRVQRQVLDMVSEYERQLRETQQILAQNIVQLREYLGN